MGQDQLFKELEDLGFDRDHNVALARRLLKLARSYDYLVVSIVALRKSFGGIGFDAKEERAFTRGLLEFAAGSDSYIIGTINQFGFRRGIPPVNVKLSAEMEVC
jgi:hypothetical protein